MGKTKRILCFILSMLLVLAIVPANAIVFAANAGETTEGTNGETVQAESSSAVAKIGTVEYETFAAAISASTAGSTIILLNDVDLGHVSSSFSMKGNVTIDGQGKWSITVDSMASYFTNEAIFAPRGPVSYTIKNVTVNLNNAAPNMAAFNMKYGGTLENVTVNGAFGKAVNMTMAYSVSVKDCAFDGATWGVYASSSGASVNVTGTKFNTTGAVYMNQNGNLTFTDNIVAADCYIETNAAADVSKNFWNGDNATGGAPTAEQLKGENFICDTYYVTNTNGVLGNLVDSGVEEEPVIRIEIDGVAYEYGPSKLALVSALLDSNAEGTNVKITLLDDVTFADGLQIAPYWVKNDSIVIVPKNVEIDLNGKTLTGFIQINDKVTATVKNGTVENVVDEYAAIEVIGTVTLENVTVKSSSKAFNVATRDVETATLIIKGGTYCSDPSAYLAFGYVCNANDDGTYTVVNPYVASVNGVLYETFDAAYNAANDGDTILLFKTAVITKMISNYGKKIVTVQAYGLETAFLVTSSVMMGTFDGMTIETDGICITFGENASDYNPTVDIYGGTYKGGVAAIKRVSGEVRIFDGTFSATDNASTIIGDAKNITVRGGKYYNFDPSVYLPASLVAVKGDDNYWTIGTPVAQIGEVKYETLQAAINDAQAGDTVKLLADITLEGSASNGAFEIAAGRTITLDLNGYNITASARTGYTGRTQYAFDNYADLTITGKGTITSRGIQNYGTLTINSADVTIVTCDANGGACVYGYASSVTNISAGTFNNNGGNNALIDTYGELYITGGTFTQNGSGASYAIICRDVTTIENAVITGVHGVIGAISNANISNANVTITSGTYTLVGVAGQSDHCIYADADATVAITGGTFVCEEHDAGGKTLCADGGAIVVSGGKFDTPVAEELCAEGYIPTTNSDGTYGVKVGSYVAEVNGVKYESIEEAITAIQAGGTLTLLADVTTSTTIVIKNNTVIDGNDHTITYTGSDRAIDIPNNTAEKVNVTIENLNVAFNGYSERGINYNDDGVLTLNNVIVNAEGKNVTYALNMPGSSDNATVVINDSALTGNIALNVWGENATITANDTVFTSVDNTTVENYAAVKLNNDASTTANGTIITINGGAVIARDQNGDPSTAVSNATATGKVNISETTEVVGKVIVPVAIVTYGGTSFYSFETLQAAINKVITDGNGTVELIADITATDDIIVDGDVTIVMNDHTVAGTVKLGTDAKLTAPSGLNVVAEEEGYTVVYENGVHSVVKKSSINVGIAGLSLTLTDYIKLNYRVNVSSLAGRTDFYAMISVTHMDCCGTDEVIYRTKLNYSEWRFENGKVYVDVKDIAAKHMGSRVSVQFFTEDGEVASNPYVYSIEKFAYSVINGTTQSDEFKTAMYSLLVYGASAQRKFGHATDNCVDADLGTAYAPENATATNTITHLEGLEENNRKYLTSANLTLVDSIEFNWFLNKLDNITADDVRVTVEYRNYLGGLKTAELTGENGYVIDNGDGRLKLKISGVCAADLMADLTIKIYIKGELTCGLIDSVARQCNSGMVTYPEDAGLYQSILNYSDSVEKYFLTLH